MMAVFTAWGRICNANVHSDNHRGGWRVECPQHGRISSGHDTLSSAEDMAMRHVIKRDAIGK